MRPIACPVADPSALFRHGGSGRTAGVVDCSANVNPLGPPPSVLQALHRELDGGAVARYPDPHCARLVRRLARRHGVAPECVVVGNGASELIQALPRACAARRVAIVEPTYTEYLRAALLAGARVEHWLAEGPSLAPAPFEPGGADLVWVCNPNNPTGQLWPGKTLAAWVAGHPETLFVVDESFLPFHPDEDEHSLVQVLEQLPNLVLVRSLTKMYALPGLRLGYVLAHPERAERLRAHLIPWSVNALAQVAGLAALDDESFVQDTRTWFQEQRAFLMAGLAELTEFLEAMPSQAPFVLLRLRSATSAELAHWLRERGILVRDASNFVGLDDRYVRIALRSAQENGLVLRRLTECLENLVSRPQGAGLDKE